MMHRTATISPCTKYRYSLRRCWCNGEESTRIVCFIMLNPSTADAETDDPTVRRCIGFAKDWNFEALEVVNLFAWRATKPTDLYTAADPIGPQNDAYILKAAERATTIVCAWGSDDFARSRVLPVGAMLKKYPLFCITQGKGCKPKHPLYAKKTFSPVLWRGALL